MAEQRSRTQQYDESPVGIVAKMKAREILQRQSGGDPMRGLALLLEAAKTVLSRNQILNFRPHKKQLEYFGMGARRIRRAFFGGNRTGKTVCGGAETAYHATGKYPTWWKGYRFEHPPLIWVASTSMEKVIEGVQSMLFGPAGQLGTGFIPGNRIRRTLRSVQHQDGIAKAFIAWGDDGKQEATIVFKSYEQDRRKFETDRVDLIWLDEEPPYDIYRECTMRLLGTRSRRGGIMLLTFTPLLGMTDVCRLFLRPDLAGIGKEAQRGNGAVIASWADNEFLDPKEVQELRESTPEYELKTREHGRPVMGSGQIYPIDEDIYRVAYFEIPKDKGWKFAIGLDHGWDHPAGLTLWTMDPNTGISYLYRTWRGTKTMIPIIAQMIKEEWARIGGQCPVFADPSGTAERQDNGGKSIFMQYSACGVNLIEADNQVEAGIMEIFAGLQSGQIQVVEGAPCIHFWEEVRLYHRKENKATGKIVIVKKDDDIMDSSRYALRHRSSWIVPRKKSRHNRHKRGKISWKAAR